MSLFAPTLPNGGTALDINNIPSNLPFALFWALCNLFRISQEMGHLLTLEPIPNQLDTFKAGDQFFSDMKWLPEAIHHSQVFGENNDYIWGFEGSNFNREAESPWLILSLYGILKPCCQGEAVLTMEFENGRNSASRITFKPDSPTPQVEAVEQIRCKCPRCGKLHLVETPTDPHTLEHWRYVLAAQENRDYYKKGVPLRRQ